MHIITSSQTYFHFVKSNFSICGLGKTLDRKIATLAQQIFSALKLLIAPLALFIGCIALFNENILCSRKLNTPVQNKELPVANTKKTSRIEADQSKASILAIGNGNLPIDPQTHILSFLKRSDLKNLIFVSKKTKDIAENDRLWTGIARSKEIPLNGMKKGIKKFIQEKKDSEFIKFFKRFFWFEYDKFLKKEKLLGVSNWKPSANLARGQAWERGDGPILWTCFALCDSQENVMDVAKKVQAALKGITLIESTPPLPHFFYNNYTRAWNVLDLSESATIRGKIRKVRTCETVESEIIIVDEEQLPSFQKLASILPIIFSSCFVRTKNPEKLPASLNKDKKKLPQYFSEVRLTTDEEFDPIFEDFHSQDTTLDKTLTPPAVT
jgi:hypothetical protein